MSSDTRQMVMLRVTPSFLERITRYQERLAKGLGLPVSSVSRQYTILHAVQQTLESAGLGEAEGPQDPSEEPSAFPNA